MRPARVGRCVVVWCAATAAAARATAPAAAPAEPDVKPAADAAPPADPVRPAVQLPPLAPGPAAAPRLRWDQVCGLYVDDGRVALRWDMTVDVLRAFDGVERSVAGMPGTTTLQLRGRGVYEVGNVQQVGPARVRLTVASQRFSLNLAMERTVDDKSVRTYFYQPVPDPNRRTAMRGDACRLSVSGDGLAGGAFTVTADDFDALRKEHPYAANRYLRPLLRRLGADLFKVDPFAARQVLFPVPGDEDDDAAGGGGGGAATNPATVPSGDKPPRPEVGPRAAPATRPAADPAAAAAAVDEAAVRALAADLGAAAFARRQAAAARLAALGPPAVAVLAKLDRRRLSAQQVLEVDLLASVATPLAADEARRLRSDPHFLFDCLYSPDAGIRAAAAARLARATGVAADRLAPVLAVRPADDPDGLLAAVEDLRDALIPKPN